MHTHHRAPLIVSGVIFSLMALAHLLRLFIGWSVVIGTFTVPVWWSVVALVIALLLAIWMFKTVCCCCGKCSSKED